MAEFWLGFAVAYFLAGGLTLRMIYTAHCAVHPDWSRHLVADLYVFFVWPAVFTVAGDDK